MGSEEPGESDFGVLCKHKSIFHVDARISYGVIDLSVLPFGNWPYNSIKEVLQPRHSGSDGCAVRWRGKMGRDRPPICALDA